MKKNRATIVAALVGLSVLGGGVAAAAGNDPSGTVLIVNGAASVDQSSAGAAANRLGGVVLLSDTDSLPATSAKALDDLNPARVIVIGGDNRISASAFGQIKTAAGSATVERVAGADRYETSAQLAALAVAAPSNGTAGKSAYQLWADMPGNSGKSEADFFASLKGTPGATGATGATGAAGPSGSGGGASAFDTWKAQPGNTNGTQTDFLASLRGDLGAPGATGMTGAAGPQGASGMAGAVGPAGTVGATGPAGPAGPTGLTGPTGPAGSGGTYRYRTNLYPNWTSTYSSNTGYSFYSAEVPCGADEMAINGGWYLTAGSQNYLPTDSGSHPNATGTGWTAVITDYYTNLAPVGAVVYAFCVPAGQVS